jgi:hypothetical protein
MTDILKYVLTFILQPLLLPYPSGSDENEN